MLRQGLSRTISEIPALAGIAVRGPKNDPRDIAIEIKEDGCVDFAYEDFSAKDGIPSYAELKQAGFPLTNLIETFSQSITLTPISEGAPMLLVKLNVLQGGLAMAFGFNHLLTDATAMAEVERLWSLHTADVSSGRQQTYRAKDANKMDVELRKRFSVPTSDAAEFENPHWTIFPTEHSQLHLAPRPISKSFFEKTKSERLPQVDGSTSVKGDPETVKWCHWYFSPESLVALKKDASGPDPVKWISTMNAMVGLFWSRLSSIRQKSRDGVSSSLCLFPMNMRSRFDPPVGSDFIGNLVDVVFTVSPLQELEDDALGLQVAAYSARSAVKGWSSEAWNSWLAMAVNLPAEQAICPNPLPLLQTHNLGFNDYSNLQSNTLDWGSDLGHIDVTRYMKPAASLAKCATAVIVHPRLRDGGLAVATTNTDSMCKALEQDHVFSRYGKLVCSYV